LNALRKAEEEERAVVFITPSMRCVWSEHCALVG
jgi:hypothetical protein